MELDENTKKQITYEIAFSNFFLRNYNFIIAKYLDEYHDVFMEYANDCYEDYEGQDMK